MYSRAQQSSKFIRTKESVYIRKELNSNSIGLVHQHLGVGVLPHMGYIGTCSRIGYGFRVSWFLNRVSFYCVPGVLLRQDS